MTTDREASTPIDAEDARRRGRMAVLTIFVLGAAMAVLGWGYIRNQQLAALRFLGPEHAERVMRAPEVHLLRVSAIELAGTTPGPRVYFNGMEHAVLEEIPADSLRGIGHLRNGLVNQVTYDFEGRWEQCSASVTHALRFRTAGGADGQTTILGFAFGRDCAYVSVAGTKNTASLTEVRTAYEQEFQAALPTK